MLIRAELLALGIDGAKMRKEILPAEYRIGTKSSPVSEGFYSLAVSGKRNSALAIQIREACFDYISKLKRKER